MKAKRLFKIAMTTLVAAVCCTSFTSCDEDQREALKLHGTWFGDFGMNYTCSYGRYDSYETTIRFSQDWFSDHGTGTQQDYYRNGPYRYIYYDFDWRITNGVVKLRYRWANEWDTNIYDYSLSNYHFRGRFDNGATFDLTSTSNWYTINNSYYNSHHYGCEVYSDWGYSYPWKYYAKEKKGADNNTASNEAKENTVQLAPGVTGVVADGTAQYYPAPSEIHLGNRNCEK